MHPNHFVCPFCMAGDIPRAMLGIDKMLATGFNVKYNSEDAVRHTARVLIEEIGLDN